MMKFARTVAVLALCSLSLAENPGANNLTEGAAAVAQPAAAKKFTASSSQGVRTVRFPKRPWFRTRTATSMAQPLAAVVKMAPFSRWTKTAGQVRWLVLIFSATLSSLVLGFRYLG